MRITTVEYILIAVGIFTLAAIVGFLILGVVAWRIGTRMEKEGQVEEDKENAYVSNSYQESLPYTEVEELPDTSMKSGRETFKLEDYSNITLENGK